MGSLRNCLIFLAAAIIFGSPTIAQNRADIVQAVITIGTMKPGPKISRDLYGQFIEHGATQIYDGIWVGENSSIPNIHGYRTGVVEALRQIHVPVVRWPGGCFADQYDWRDGIGPRDKRPVRSNALQGGQLDSNAFGTHEFLDFAELIGAEAYVSANLGSLTPLEAAHWFEYMTSSSDSTLANERRRNGRDNPWKVKYAGLGNEIWGCGGMMSANYALDVERQYAFFFTPPQGQELVKIASGPWANTAGYEDFIETLLKNPKDPVGTLLFQALSVHYYTGIGRGERVFETPSPYTGFGEEGWARYLQDALYMERVIASTSVVMDKYDPEKKVALAVDEWGTMHTSETAPHSLFPTQSTLLDAEVAALTLNIFHRHTDRLRIANNSEMVNVLQALILTDKERMLLTPVYYIFDMYQSFQEAMPLAVSITSPQYTYGGHAVPAVDVSAARGADGKIYLALVDLDPHHSAEVYTDLTGHAHGRVLTGPTIDAHNTFDAPNLVRPIAFTGIRTRHGKLVLVLPAKSIVVVAIDG